MGNLSKLNTHHDKFNIHKTLGIYCISHYIYRLARLIKYGSMGFVPEFNSGSNSDLILSVLSVSPHLLLPLTSFFFKVLRYRSKAQATVIWEEMRFHSIIFTARSIFVFIFNILAYSYTNTNFHPDDDHTNNDTDQDKKMKQKWLTTMNVGSLILVIICHGLADLATSKFGKSGQSTIRVIHSNFHNTDPLLFRFIKRFYSISQIAATIVHLYPYNRIDQVGIRLDTTFGTAIGIHFAAFLMTLNLKNVITKQTYNVGYIISLLVVWFITFTHLGAFNLEFILSCLVLYAIRIITPPTDYSEFKYLMWVTFFLVINVKNNVIL